MNSASESPPKRFGPQALLQRLTAAERRSPLYVGFSGGADSLALVHAGAAAGLELYAVHVDHGLHPESAHWAERCEHQARSMGVAFQCLELGLGGSAERSEGHAREARYKALSQALPKHATLLTAHHADDQAETLLLRLLRGSGVDGLAAMPRCRALGDGWLVRPLLDLPRESLRRYVQASALVWIEDPANADMRHDRAWLRHALWPQMAQRFPGLRGRLERLALAAGEAREASDWFVSHYGLGSARLPVDAIRRLPEVVQRQAVRGWLRKHGARPPGGRRLAQGLSDLLRARRDAAPELRWPGGVIRRFRDELYFADADPPVPPPPQSVIVGEALELGAATRLTWCRAQRGLTPGETLTVAFRGGGERLRIGGCERSLKSVLHGAALPPWRRPCVPLLWRGDTLVAVAGVALADEVDGPGLAPEWRYQ